MDRSKRTTVTTLSGVAIAAAAAGLFITQTVAPVAADQAKIHCSGVNSCKGKSECASSKSSCKGQNSCKGQGWLPLDDKTCRAKGGVVEKEKT